MTILKRPIAIMGAGAWGTALANAFGQKGLGVSLIDRDPARAHAMATARENRQFLPGITLSPNVKVTADKSALTDATTVLMAVPAQQLRAALQSVVRLINVGTPVLVCAKGIEIGTGCFMSQIVAEEIPAAIPGILSGPSFAADVARGLPTAVILASSDQSAAATLACNMSSATLRIYHGGDVRGAEIGGATKNVLAIACGIVHGRELGESARAALLARGFAEITRFARAFGAQPETLMGLSGLGDTVLTCSSKQSRNFAFGEALGRSLPPEEARGGKLVEGALTASALITKAQTVGVEMPICEAVDAIVAGRLTIDQAIETLMNRPIKPEA